MAVKERTTIALDPEVKREATDVLEQMGLSLSSFTEICLRQVVRDKGMPFTPSLRPTRSDGYPVPRFMMRIGSSIRRPRVISSFLRSGMTRRMTYMIMREIEVYNVWLMRVEFPDHPGVGKVRPVIVTRVGTIASQASSSKSPA